MAGATLGPQAPAASFPGEDRVYGPEPPHTGKWWTVRWLELGMDMDGVGSYFLMCRWPQRVWARGRELPVLTLPEPRTTGAVDPPNPE